MNGELLEQVVYTALAASVFTTAAVQQIKSGVNFKNSKILVWVSLAISMLLGTAFAKCFTDLKIMYCLWVGLVSWLGATGIYTGLEKLGVVRSLSDIQKEKEETIELVRKDNE